MTDRLTPQREAEIREQFATWPAHATIPSLLAELAAVRAERDEARERLAAICGWNPVQATTDCDWDRNCPVHGEVAR